MISEKKVEENTEIQLTGSSGNTLGFETYKCILVKGEIKIAYWRFPILKVFLVDFPGDKD